ncbi:uncharacterized protein N7484_009007 [Penicillium longicatenatum]|uniref:uncharacterized protein n=1 Tax=Penicillium longicatenatum TaxID=1561947 RepID=UPI0025481D06|nr:uncharacterized protein N7484_009007 [Penicillium longicatenatum]KAJ5635694.1 hypothetical protein N7484_009007 [Penicillium longicatenatum]
MPSLKMGAAHMALFARDLASTESTFTSWDKCMAKSYCKWPVIVAIIIVSVILIAVIGCIVNCICCGYRCCTACCGCCCPSGRRRNKQPKYYDDPPLVPPGPTPSYNQSPGYNPTPTYNQQPTTPAPPLYRGAVQTATFDTAKSPTAKINEDALPEMPTWANAVDKHVEDTSPHEDVEMEPLNPADRKHGAGTPMHVNTFADYPPDRGTGTPASAGYRGFTPTDPYARRSPAPAALAATQDPYGRRSPGVTSPAAAAAIDPYNRRSPGPGAAMDPYGRRSPGPAAAFAAAQDPYARRSPGPNAAYAPAQDPYGPRSPGLTSPVGAVSPYNNQPYDQHQGYDQHQPYDHVQPYDDYSPGGANQMANPTATGYAPHGLTSPSPVAAYNPHTNYGTAQMPSSDAAHNNAGFTRQPSFGSSQYPPTYTSQPPYRGVSPALPASPPPSFPAPSPHDFQSYEYHAQPIGHAVSAPIGQAVSPTEEARNRPPTLLMSGRQPATNF